jgi:hypothetical protein
MDVATLSYSQTREGSITSDSLLDMWAARANLPIRLPRPGEAGIRFSDWLLDYVPKRPTRDRVTVFLQQWDHLRDSLGREPTIREYAQEWRVPEAIAYRQAAEFRSTFNAGPGAVCELLWDAVSQQQGGRFGLVPVLGVDVVPAA